MKLTGIIESPRRDRRQTARVPMTSSRLAQSQIDHRRQRCVESKSATPRGQSALHVPAPGRATSRFAAQRLPPPVPKATAPAHRAGGSRSRLPHRHSARRACADRPVASSSSARVCCASLMLRRKRMTPAGRTRLKPCAFERGKFCSARSRRPASSLPHVVRFRSRAVRHVSCSLVPMPVFLQLLLQFFQQIQRLQAESANSHQRPRCDRRCAARAA